MLETMAASGAFRRPQYGPWCEAFYRGECAGCGYEIRPGNQIRSDGRGGWLCEICGDRGSGMVTVPVIPGLL